MSSVTWVFVASLIVWGGLYFYLVSVDRRLSKLERQDERDSRR